MRINEIDKVEGGGVGKEDTVTKSGDSITLSVMRITTVLVLKICSQTSNVH